MKEFMKTNRITHNLMSFTGFKTMLILSLLMQGPKTYNEIKYALENHEYLHETVSNDTIRIYINSLIKAGFNIKREKKKQKVYFSVESIPFELSITDEQAKNILKIYNAISKSISLAEYISLKQFFSKFSQYVANDELKLKFENISPLANINTSLIDDLIKYTKNKNEITIVYNSRSSKTKPIVISPDKLQINNNKLYLYGYNHEHQNYGSFLVENIVKIQSINLNKKSFEIPILHVVYKLKKNGEELELVSGETLISEDDDSYTIELISKNEFDAVQRILFFSDRCKVLSPSGFKKVIIDTLVRMKEGYKS